jgi:UDP-4-amino-4,6-dideoxy-N-acetyl-beta-L-altrosamine N-acetyltransferase
MLSGKKIYLSSVEESSLEKLRQWRNKPELRRYFREYREISSTMQKNWFNSRVLDNPNQVDFEIHDKHTDKLLGHCGLYYINWIHRHAEFGIYIGDEDFRQGGYGSDALRTLLKYGFNDLNLNKIWCEVYSNNDAIGVYRHIGFVDEGCLRQNYFNEGQYWDCYLMSMLREEYREKYDV